MQLSISTGFVITGDFACSLTFTAGEYLKFDTEGFGDPEHYAQEISRFAQLLADFKDDSSEVPSFGVLSGMPGDETFCGVRVAQTGKSSLANLTVTRVARYSSSLGS